MIEIGKTATLPILKQVDFGFYLDAGPELDEILLPLRYAPAHCKVGDEIHVFLYLDSEDRPIATTEIPLAEVGEVAHLSVKGNSEFGSFLDWGLSKDLLCPFKEQRVPMKEGNSYSVFLFIDNSGRIAASSKLDHFLQETDEQQQFSAKERVRLHICRRSDLGYKAVINGTHLGLIHHGDMLAMPAIGSITTGYIKQIREDGRIDLTLLPSGTEATDALSEKIIDFLEQQNGRSDMTDKSPPEVIYQHFQVSKSRYKKALGKLYKEKRILIEKDSIALL